MIAAMDLVPGDKFIDEDGCGMVLVRSIPSEDRLFITLLAACLDNPAPHDHHCTDNMYEMTHTFKVPGE